MAERWTPAQKARLKELRIDSHKSSPSRLRALTEHFSNDPQGSVFAVTDGDKEPHVSKALAKKVRDRAAEMKLEWVLTGEEPPEDGQISTVEYPDSRQEVVKSPPSKEHVVAITAAAIDLRNRLRRIPPLPSHMVTAEGTSDEVHMGQREIRAALDVDAVEVQVVLAHIGGDGPSAARVFSEGLLSYVREADAIYSRVINRLRKRLKGPEWVVNNRARAIGSAIYLATVDRAIYIDQRYKNNGKPMAAAAELHYLQGSRSVVATDKGSGPSLEIHAGAKIATTVQPEEAPTIIDVTKKAWAQLEEDKQIDDLISTYFRLVGQRDDLSRVFSPISVETAARLGRCEWCF